MVNYLYDKVSFSFLMVDCSLSPSAEHILSDSGSSEWEDLTAPTLALESGGESRCTMGRLESAE